jgi:hypothetical protein
MVPHAPQFDGSDPVLVHEPSQQTSRRLPHAVPKLPQLEWSVFMSTQVPLHLVCPVGQAAMHCPFSQVSPAAQIL